MGEGREEQEGGMARRGEGRAGSRPKGEEGRTRSVSVRASG